MNNILIADYFCWCNFLHCLSNNILHVHIHVIPPWSSSRLQEMSHKILLKCITFFQNFEISRKWMKNILIYSIHFSKTSRKWKKNLPDASLKFFSHVCKYNFNLLGVKCFSCDHQNLNLHYLTRMCKIWPECANLQVWRPAWQCTI